MNIHNCKNVKIKAEFVLNNLEKIKKSNVYRFYGNAYKLAQVLKRDGVKCHCCGRDNIFYQIKKGYLVAFVEFSKKPGISSPRIMTVDHDLLSSLGGSNSIDNYHALCEYCNNTRGNSFAEYSEFKSWYDERKAKRQSISPLSSRNFTLIDLEKELQNSGIVNINLEDGIPKIISDSIFNNAIRTGNLKNYGTPKLYQALDRKQLNLLLTKAVHKFIKQKYNFDIPVPQDVYQICTIKTPHNMKPLTYFKAINESFRNHINRIYNKESTRIGQEASKLRRQQQVQQEMVLVPDVPKKDSFWNRIMLRFNLAA